MNRKTHTLMRTATRLALTFAALALSLPAAGLARDRLDPAAVARYGPPDPWLYPYINSGSTTSSPASLRDGRSPDTLDAADLAAYGPPDPWLYPYINSGSPTSLPARSQSAMSTPAIASSW